MNQQLVAKVANELIPVYKTDLGEHVVDGRELHKFLNVGKDFTTWIKDRIEKYGFTEGEEFSPVLVKTSDGGRPRTEYILKLDTAKELAMVENNDQGRNARRYFIEVEKKLKSITTPSYMIDDPVQRAEKWIEEAKEKQLLLVANNQKDQIIGELKPKADYTDSILKNKSLVNTNQIAKDYGMSATALNKKLNELGVQYKQGDQWLLYSKYHAKGYTHSETTNITRSSGAADTIMRTKWTQKGRLFIYNLLKQNGILPMIEREDIA